MNFFHGFQHRLFDNQFVFNLEGPPQDEVHVWLTHLDLEYGADILCVSSTHVPYSHIKYEPQTPSLSGSTRHGPHLGEERALSNFATTQSSCVENHEKTSPEISGNQ